MTRFSLTLPQRNGRLVALAIAYHLARPGSEINPITLSNYEHGLSEAAEALTPQLEKDSIELGLTPFQLTRLNTAMLSTISELKSYSLLDSAGVGTNRPRSVAPGFDNALHQLFPTVAISATTIDLAEEMMLLRRGLSSSINRAEEALVMEMQAAEIARKKSKKSWQFWRRNS